MPQDNQSVNRGGVSVLLDLALLGLSAVTTAILLAWILYYSGYGLNLTDEGFYLAFIANPFPYAINVSTTLFGFVYHWPYEWVAGNVAVLRMANITLTMALSLVLSFLVIRRLWTVGWAHAAVLSAGIATLALCEFPPGWFTPNYQGLAFQSLSMIMIGLLVAEQPRYLCQLLAGMLIGIGGWCCFMAKATTAAAVSIAILLYFVLLGRKSLPAMLAAASIALALLIVAAYFIDGGMTGLVTRMLNSAELESLLGIGHEISHIFRIDALDVSRSQLTIAVLLATIVLLSSLMEATHKWLPGLVLGAALIITIAIVLLGFDLMSINRSVLFLVPAFTGLAAIFYRGGFVLRTQTRTSIALAVGFLILPHVCALGSVTNYWRIGSLAALFWMLAVLAFLSPFAQQGRSIATLLPLTVLAQLLTASIVNGGLLKPFRQVEDLRGYRAVMSMPGGGKLVLSKSFHDYLANARAEAREAGLEVGTSVVDLTGLSPGLLYVLETRPLGLPWLTGGLPGSNAAAVEALRLENCSDLAKAWLLIEPGGPYQLDAVAVMASFGAERSDYVAAATLAPPVLDGEWPDPAKQFLLKPIRPGELAQAACHTARLQRPHGQKWNRW
ncbi:hypothetical protein [Bradyrhizobium ottawaense]|uniref:hypothetical protein n=1 Tax=Bradyrhizobium ottawaense TaxID=931866 RepID=UPI003FA0BA74